MPQRSSTSVEVADRGRFISVELEQVRLSLDGRTVLRGIDWTIRPAQRWLLTGHNGAGKTLLMKVIAGDVWPSANGGRRRYLYRDERFDEPYGVKQEIAYLGAERQDRYQRYGWDLRVEQVVGTGLHRTDIMLDPWGQTDRQRVARLLRRLRLQPLAHRRFLTLSYGERRLVLLARALAAAPKLLLLDELFNGLDDANRAHALHCLTVLSRSALPWVLSSHRPEEVSVLITHRCELADGKIRSQGPVSRTQGRRSARVADPAARRARTSFISRAAGDAPALVRLRRASVWREGIEAVRGLSLALRAGECWLLHGPNGSGKSSLVQLLYGDLGVARGGHIERAGIIAGVPIAQFKRRVGLVAPELQAIHPRHLRVDEVVASGLCASIGYPGARAPRDRRVRRALRRVGAGALERRTLRTLSYGQLRRVLFARALVGEPDILLLDEPYAGLDELTRGRLRALVDRAVQAGITVLIATHHEQDCPSGATHELELVGGRAAYLGPLRGRAGSWGRAAGAIRATKRAEGSR